MKDTNAPSIFFHVGTGKTGTTFLQYRVFPKFKGISYIQRTNYKRAKDIIRNSSDRHFLISREFDQQLEHEVKSFANDYPNTTPIIVFRKQDSYAASQYRRFVKNGFRGSITDFLDIDKDAGHFQIRDFKYMDQIRILERHFNSAPIVLFYEDMRDDPKRFISELAIRISATVEVKDIDFSRKHTSYSEKQLKFIHLVGQKMNLRIRKVSNVKVLQWLWNFGIRIVRYCLLYLSHIIPESFLPSKALIPKEELERISAFFKEDWEETQAYAVELRQKRANEAKIA